jgi:hypothetical protein
MNLVMHVVRADVRRLAVPMLLWIGLAAADRVMHGVGPLVTPEPSVGELFSFGAGLLLLARIALGAALIAMIVQAYPLVGSTAFWMTRPIPPGVLLGSRLLLVGALFILVPALFDALLMALYRVRPADMGLVLIEGAILAAVASVCVMTAAAWTRTFARFVVLCASALLVLVVAGNLLLVIALSTAPSIATFVALSDGAATLVTRAADPTGGLIAWLAIITTGVLLLRALYRTRSRRRSIAVAVAGALSACLLAILWPWPLLEAEAAAPPWAADPAAVRIQAIPGTLTFDRVGRRVDDAARWYTARVRAYLTGVPAGWVAVVSRERATLAFAGREVSGGPFSASTLPGGAEVPHPMHAALQAALGVNLLESADLYAWPDLPILAVRESDLPAPGTVASYRGDFRIDLRKIEVASVLPLQPGAMFQDGSYRLVLDDVFVSEGGPRLRLRSSTARPVLHASPRPAYSFYLRNPTTRDAVAGTLQQRYQGPWFPGYWLDMPQGFRASAALIRFPSIASARLPSAGAAPAGGEDWRHDAWLAGAELVIIRTVPAGSVDRTLEMPELTVNLPRQ